jgi:hypothetical protein
MARSGDTRRELINAVVNRKESLWGQGDRPYSFTRNAQNVAKPPGGRAPSMAVLRWAAYDATDDELIRAASRQSSQFAFLYYK